MKKLVIFLAVLTLALVSVLTFNVGAAEPTSITSLSQITNMSGDYVLAQDIKDAGAPNIGTETAPFKGSLDGAGFSISGLTGPIFAYTKTADISNIIIKDSTVELEDLKTHTGLVVGTAIGGTFTEVHAGPGVSIKISKTTVNDLYIGGLFGFVSDAFEISFCSFEGSLVYESDNKSRMGGVVGVAYGLSPQDSVITNCWNTGLIKNLNSQQKKDTKVAGVVGCGEEILITKCYNTGEVRTSEMNGQTAGIFGCPSDWSNPNYKVELCYNTGKIWGGNYSAGIMGYSNRAGGVLENCVNLGKVGGGNNVGGVIGMNKNTEKVKNIISLAGMAPSLYNDGNGNGQYDLATVKMAKDMAEAITLAKGFSDEFAADTAGNLCLKWQLTYKMPDTGAPATSETTAAPTTAAPTTAAPTTATPTTNAPSTNAPSTNAPSTNAPATNAPATKAPATEAPKNNDSGCKSAIGTAAVAVVMLGAVAGAVVLKKKED